MIIYSEKVGKVYSVESDEKYVRVLNCNKLGIKNENQEVVLFAFFKLCCTEKSGTSP